MILHGSVTIKLLLSIFSHNYSIVRKPREPYILTSDGLPSDIAALLPAHCQLHPRLQQPYRHSWFLFPAQVWGDAVCHSEQSGFAAPQPGCTWLLAKGSWQCSSWLNIYRVMSRKGLYNLLLLKGSQASTPTDLKFACWFLGKIYL